MNADFLKKINDTLFITSEMNKQSDLYRWSPPKDLETRFGVELEACIRTTPKCINFNMDFTSFVGFKEKFDAYYRNIITKSPYFQELAEQYGYLLVIDVEKRDAQQFYYDMNNPTIPGLDSSQLLKLKYKEEDVDPSDIWNPYHQMILESVSRIVEKGHKYELPMFVDDRSIRCGDTKNWLVKESANIHDINSFRFECITPILSIKGYPTKEKIKQVMYPMLSLFGLDKSQCFIQNFSMGFHVNASLYNTNADKYVAIAEPPFLNRLLRNYINVEKMVYSSVRKRKPVNAAEDYFTVFARPLHKNLNNFKLTNPTLTENQIINTIMAEKVYMNEKYKGLKRKSPFLLEFRLFEGDNDINRLVNHVFTALDILHKTANEISRSEQKLTYVRNNINYNYTEPEINPNTISPSYGGKKQKTLKKKYRLKKYTQKRR